MGLGIGSSKGWRKRKELGVQVGVKSGVGFGTGEEEDF